MKNGKTRAGEVLSKCKACVVIEKGVQHDDVTGYVPVGKVWHLVDELYERVGQARAAELCGVTADTYRAWLYRRSLRMQARGARRLLVALQGARAADTRAKPTTGRTMRHKAKTHCVECGTILSNYTEGCTACWDRRRKREAAP